MLGERLLSVERNASTMQSNDAAAPNAAMSAYYAAMSRYGDILPGGYRRQGSDGTWMIFTGVPTPNLNVVYVEPERILGEVNEFADELSKTGVPWNIQVRGEISPELLDLATRYGKTSSEASPLLLWDAELLRTLPEEVPRDARVRKVSGAECDVFAGAMAAGFGAPRAAIDTLARPALLDAPDVTGFVLEVNGEGVATGHNIRVEDHVVMFGGSVPARHRRNGYYRALVAARLRDAVADGARYAVSENSPMSRPLFESFGSRHFETLTHLNSP